MGKHITFYWFSKFRMNAEDLLEEPFCCRHSITPHTSFIYHDSTGPNGSRTQFAGNEWGVPGESVFCRDIQIGSPELPHSSIRYRLWQTVDEVLGGNSSSHFHVEITTRYDRTSDERVNFTLAHIREKIQPAIYVASDGGGAIIFHYVDTDKEVIALLGINNKGIVYMPGHRTMNPESLNVWQTLDDFQSKARIIKNDKSSITTLEALIYVEIESNIIPVVFGVSFVVDPIEDILETVERMVIAHAHDQIPSNSNMLRHIIDPYMYIYSQ